MQSFRITLEGKSKSPWTQQRYNKGKCSSPYIQTRNEVEIFHGQVTKECVKISVTQGSSV